MIVFLRRTWLPRTLEALAPWLANFAVKFAQFHLSLGFKPADNTAVQNANETVQWLNDAMEINAANTAGLKTFRDQTLYGEKNDSPPSAPTTDLPAPPAGLSSSIVQWLITLSEKIELADGYTPDIGAQLGIVATPSGGISEANIKPSLKVFAATEDYLFSVVVEGRGKSDQNDLQFRVPGQEKFDSLLRFTGKASDARYRPATEGAPAKIEVRVQLYRKNEKYGQPSDPAYITLNP